MQIRFLFFSIACLLHFTIQSPKFDKLTLPVLKSLRQEFSERHHIIIVNQTLAQQSSFPVNPLIHYYSHNCTLDKELLSACAQGHNTWGVLIYNKVVVEFEAYSVIGKWTNQYINTVVQKGIIKDPSEEEILKIIEEKNEIFLLVENKTVRELQIGFRILAKQFPFSEFIYLSEGSLPPSYNLSYGDFMHIKTTKQEFPNSLPKILKSETHTTYLPRQLNKRYDMMKLFVLENIYTRGFDKRIDNIEKGRFSLKRKAESQQKTVVVFCDLSPICVQYWKRLDQELFSENQLPNQTSFKRVFYRAEALKSIQIIQLYYHIKLLKTQLPFVLVLNGEDESISNLPLRYKKSLSFESGSYLSQINSFLNQIDNGIVKSYHLSSGVPKKNGFTGKGSQKFIQKLTFQTYKKVLLEAKSKGFYYLLYITAFDFECPQCLSFYGEFKKLASFLNGEDMKVIFGVFDLSKDQIDLKSLSNIPDTLLFSPYSSSPVQYHNRYEFQALHRFLKNQIGKESKEQQKQEDL